MRPEFALAAARISNELLVNGSVQSRTDTDATRKELEKAHKQAHEHGFVRIELESRLALAELDRQAGRVEKAKTQLALVEKDAQKMGFALIARQAASVAR